MESKTSVVHVKFGEIETTPRLKELFLKLNHVSEGGSYLDVSEVDKYLNEVPKSVKEQSGSKSTAKAKESPKATRKKKTRSTRKASVKKPPAKK